MLENIPAKPIKIWPCKVRTIMEDLDAADREILANMIADKDWPINTISRELRKVGITIAGHTINTHRQGNCSC